MYDTEAQCKYGEENVRHQIDLNCSSHYLIPIINNTIFLCYYLIIYPAFLVSSEELQNICMIIPIRSLQYQ